MEGKLTKKEYSKKLENALINARFYGWERGKEQVKTPHDFTLADDTYIENIWKELMADISDDEIKEVILAEAMIFTNEVNHYYVEIFYDNHDTGMSIPGYNQEGLKKIHKLGNNYQIIIKKKGGKHYE